MPGSAPTPLLFVLFAGVFPFAIIVYALLAVVVHTRWELDSTGICLRAAALFFVPVRIAWQDVVQVLDCRSVRLDLMPALKLDGRHLFQRHAVIRKRSGFTRAVRFTPTDVDALFRELDRWLAGRPGWRRTVEGWSQQG